MPLNLADWTVSAVEIDVLGNPMKVSRARMSDFAKLQKFLNRLPKPQPDPPDFAGLVDRIAGTSDLSSLPPDLVESHLEASRKLAGQLIDAHLRDARAEADSWPPELGIEDRAFRLLMTADDGSFEVFFGALSRHQPELTRDQARQLFDDAPVETYGAIVAAFLGGNDDPSQPARPGASDPKAAGPDDSPPAPPDPA